MSAVELDKIYTETETHIVKLRTSLLDKHLANSLATPDEFDYDVKSYCILCHAAFEDYIETISLKVMEFSISNYIFNHKISESIISLLHFKSTAGASYLNKLEDDTSLLNIYDYIRKELENVKSSFSKEIIMQNHGVSIKYMRQLLMPVAIDIPNDIKLLSSLSMLANERGFHAHKFLEKGVLRRSIAPEDAKKIVEDCLEICLVIRDKAKTRVV